MTARATLRRANVGRRPLRVVVPLVRLAGIRTRRPWLAVGSRAVPRPAEWPVAHTEAAHPLDRIDPAGPRTQTRRPRGNSRAPRLLHLLAAVEDVELPLVHVLVALVDQERVLGPLAGRATDHADDRPADRRLAHGFLALRESSLRRARDRRTACHRDPGAVLIRDVRCCAVARRLRQCARSGGLPVGAPFLGRLFLSLLRRLRVVDARLSTGHQVQKPPLPVLPDRLLVEPADVPQPPRARFVAILQVVRELPAVLLAVGDDRVHVLVAAEDQLLFVVPPPGRRPGLHRGPQRDDRDRERHHEDDQDGAGFAVTPLRSRQAILRYGAVTVRSSVLLWKLAPWVVTTNCPLQLFP